LVVTLQGFFLSAFLNVQTCVLFNSDLQEYCFVIALVTEYTGLVKNPAAMINVHAVAAPPRLLSNAMRKNPAGNRPSLAQDAQGT
jgi:hypothetical protein